MNRRSSLMMLSIGRAFQALALLILLLGGLRVAHATECTDLRQYRSAGTTAVVALLRSKVEVSHHRIALVVGNNYAGTTEADSPAALKNAVPDAQTVGVLLRRMKFDVICLLNASYDELGVAIDLVGEHDPLEGVAAFYFAGHGFSLDGENFLVMDDARLGSVDQLLEGSFPAADVGLRLTMPSKLEILQLGDVGLDCTAQRTERCRTREEIFGKAASPRPTLMIFDMCRELIVVRDEQGQIEMRPFSDPSTNNWPLGSITLWSAGANQFAADLPMESNGLLIKHLLRFLTLQSVDVETRLRLALDEVRQDPSSKAVPQLLLPLSMFWRRLFFTEGDEQIRDVEGSGLASRLPELLEYQDCLHIGEQRSKLRAAIASTAANERKRRALRAGLLNLFKQACTSPDMVRAAGDLRDRQFSLGIEPPAVTLLFFSHEPIVVRTTEAMRFLPVQTASGPITADDRPATAPGRIAAILTPTTWQITPTIWRVDRPAYNYGGHIGLPSSSRELPPQTAESEARDMRAETRPFLPVRLLTATDGASILASSAPSLAVPIDTTTQTLVTFNGATLAASSRRKLIDFVLGGLATDPYAGFVLVRGSRARTDSHQHDLDVLRYDAATFAIRSRLAALAARSSKRRFFTFLGNPADNPFIAVPGIGANQLLVVRVRLEPMRLGVQFDDKGARTRPFDAPDPFARLESLTPSSLRDLLSPDQPSH